MRVVAVVSGSSATNGKRARRGAIDPIRRRISGWRRVFQALLSSDPTNRPGNLSLGASAIRAGSGRAGLRGSGGRMCSEGAEMRVLPGDTAPTPMGEGLRRWAPTKRRMSRRRGVRSGFARVLGAARTACESAPRVRFSHGISARHDHPGWAGSSAIQPLRLVNRSRQARSAAAAPSAEARLFGEALLSIQSIQIKRQ